MSLIHLEKSVLTFHFKEILEDGHGNHPLTWLGLGVLILGPKFLPAPSTTPQSAPKNATPKPLPLSMRSGVPLSQWVAAKQQELSQKEQLTHSRLEQKALSHHF
jgi:hypothetical protein